MFDVLFADLLRFFVDVCWCLMIFDDPTPIETYVNISAKRNTRWFDPDRKHSGNGGLVCFGTPWFRSNECIKQNDPFLGVITHILSILWAYFFMVLGSKGVMYTANRKMERARTTTTDWHLVVCPLDIVQKSNLSSLFCCMWKLYARTGIYLIPFSW